MKIWLQKESYMNAHEMYELLIKLSTALKEVLVGGTGGMIAYMVEYKRKKALIPEHEWSSGGMIIHIFIGSFIAYIAGTFMAADMTYRDGLIGLVGLTSYSLVGLLESNFTKWAIDVFMAMIGGKK